MAKYGKGFLTLMTNSTFNAYNNVLVQTLLLNKW